MNLNELGTQAQASADQLCIYTLYIHLCPQVSSFQIKKVNSKVMLKIYIITSLSTIEKLLFMYNVYWK